MARTPRLKAVRTRTRVEAGVLVGLLTGLVFLLARDLGAFDRLEGPLVDFRTRAFRGSPGPDPRIVMAVVESGDIETMKRESVPWPWPLEYNALAFRWMAACGVRLVVVDVYQVDRGMSAEERGIDAKDTKAREVADGEAQEARLLAKWYGKTTGVVLAYELLDGTEPPAPIADALRRPLFERYVAALPPLDVPTGLVKPQAYLPVVHLLQAARGVGYANAFPDDDGIIRRALPVALLRGAKVPSLPLAGAILAVDRAEGRGTELRLGDAVQALNPDGSFYVSFRGDAHAYPEVHPSDMIMAGNLLEQFGDDYEGAPPSFGSATPEAVRGKIVVWGVNPAGIKDVVVAPVGEGSYPGPELQATILDNLLRGDGRVAASRLVNTTVLLLATLLVALGASLSRRAGFLVLLPLVLVAGWCGAWLAFRAGVVLDLATPTLAVGVSSAAMAGIKVLTEGRRNRWLEGTFGKYLAPSVIEALKQDPTLIQLGGRRVEISVLFSDVKGFTSISERLEPEDLVTLLNRYLTRQSAEVLAEEGVIDKFIGDAVMAFFGDPIAHADHALRACRAAIRSAAATGDLDEYAKGLGIGPVVNRIGVNTGPALVGNMGSEARFDYTAMGDTVNLASRLEGANKAFGTRVLVGPRTWALAGGALVARPVARLRVVGKEEPVEVHDLLGLVGETPEPLAALAKDYAAAHAAVLADDLEGALGHLARASKHRPGDGLCLWLGRVIDDLLAGRRPRPWDGIHVLDAK